MKNTSNYNLILSPFIDECKLPIHTMHFSSLKHVFRERKKYVDALARLRSEFQSFPFLNVINFNELFRIYFIPLDYLNNFSLDNVEVKVIYRILL